MCLDWKWPREVSVRLEGSRDTRGQSGERGVRMFEQRSRHAYKSESQVSGKLWGLECRLVGSVFLLQGVRVQAQQKFHHPAIPRAGWGGGGVIGRQSDNVFFILCHCGKMPNTSNSREKGFVLSYPWLKKAYHGAEVMVSGTACSWNSGGRMR